MALRNAVKEKLARGEVVASMTVRMSRGIEIAQIAAATGFDTLYVDLEHNSLSIETTAQICQAALLAGVAPFVRVPALDSAWIGRVLDGGALGIIAPHIHSAEEAAAVVRMVKFPPLGDRSAGGPMPHLGFRALGQAETYAAMNEASMVIAMLETVAALDQVEAIAAVPGIDMLLVGSNDLTAEMGIAGEYEHPRLREAFARAIAAMARHGKHVGIGGLAGRPDLAAAFVKMGARYVSTGTDLGFLLGACAAKAREVRAMQP